MTTKVTWPQILAWRLRRQFVSAADGPGAVAVVERLCGVQAQVASSARLAVAVRSAEPDPGAIDRALWTDRTLVKTWLMRGTLHLLPAGELAGHCSALASLRFWEKGSWQRGHGVTAAEIAAIIDAVPSALGERALTREELVDAVVAATGDAHLRQALTSGWGVLLKPLSRLGELCYGPPRDGKVTFTAPRSWVPGWPGGLPPYEEAGVRVARAFLGAHGPATPEMFDKWLFGGVARKGVLKGWFGELGPELTEIEADDGMPLLALTEHLDDLAATAPSSEVHLLPGFDQYILGAPRTLAPLVPPALKSKVSRQAGWISPVVVHEGRVAGTWEAKGGEIALDLAEPVPQAPLDAAVARVRALVAG
ncbi:Winged helix DNA-binding domain-containing protein [Nonomuraea solani]|uniref:Winged helix DNA-binding domain-containing protein n=1 Tax=Nonomuraea solani TaxID=1144553 RepID=A0A1H6A175_9ACTN|nr:crosslink repair DNA glycosylase YcaQ family protein [Nonomuraea solani]SEG42513.1 Winged helix DNA-binding domain-containing protein [Nonomuraea solani]